MTQSISGIMTHNHNQSMFYFMSGPTQQGDIRQTQSRFSQSKTNLINVFPATAWHERRHTELTTATFTIFTDCVLLQQNKLQQLLF